MARYRRSGQMNLSDLNVKHHLFEVAKYWIETYDIDGMRLDSADVMDFQFVNYSTTSNRASSLLKRSRKGYLLFLLDRVIYYGIVLAMRPVVQQANPGVPPVYITASYAASEQFFR